MLKYPFLFLVLVVSLTACAVLGAERSLEIATFQADVTPPLGSPLLHGNRPPVKMIADPLSARGIILLTDQPPIVLCAVDWARISNAGYDAFVEALAKSVGTSTDRVSVHIIQQHDAPGIDFSTEELLVPHGLGGKMFDVAFAEDAIRRTARAAGEAVRRPRSVTHLGYGMAKVEKVASNRRILGPDGKCIMMRASACRDAKAIAAPEGVVDPYLRTLSFWEEDRPLVAVSFYACHPCSYYGQGEVSADFFGMARDARETALAGVPQIIFGGAGGNIACGKYNDGSRQNRPVLAARLEKGMKLAWEATKKVPVTAGVVSWRSCQVRLPLSKSLDEAKSLRELENTKLSTQQRVYAARWIAWIRRVSSGRTVQLSCLRIGPSYVLLTPGEMFVEYQLAAQNMRPNDFVCMANYGEGGMGYICTKIAYSQGGYEAGWPSLVAPEVEDVLMPAIRELLNP
jgi:hypothetical protein